MRKIIFSVLFFFMTSPSFAQKIIALDKINFSERPAELFNGIPIQKQGPILSKYYMIVWDTDNNKWFSYHGYVTLGKIEIYTFHGTVAGYGIQVLSLEEQEKIASYLKKQYPSIKVYDEAQKDFYKLTQAQEINCTK